MKMGTENIPKAFLTRFEWVGTTAQWPYDQWVILLAPYLTGPAQAAYWGLDSVCPELPQGQGDHFVLHLHHGEDLPSEILRGKLLPGGPTPSHHLETTRLKPEKRTGE